MKIIISPAKSLDFENNALTNIHSQPRFLEETKKINKILKTLSRKKLVNLMSISNDLATLNYQRNQDWQLPFSKDNAKQAIYAFTGAVFKGLDIKTIPEEKIPLLQDQLRIVSGLYGLLKPLDLIQPYRLEMGTKLKIGKNENLYQFWDTTLAKSLNNELKDDELLINLASAEYFKALPKKVLKVPMVTPVFKEFKNGQYKTIMTYAKIARGLMVRYIINQSIETIEDLKGFNYDGYGFSEALSSGNELVFTR